MNVEVYGTQWFYREELYSLIATGKTDLLWCSVFEVAALSLLVHALLCWTRNYWRG